MPDLQSRRRCLRVPAALLLVALVGGCYQPLAVQDPYFASAVATATLGAEARHVVRYNEALRAARRSCIVPKPDVGERDGPDAGARAGRAALADLCAASPRPAAAAFGGTTNAYRRWVEDRVRELPEPSATAARAGE